jgi:YegS/Rv2252/BmrU family lipid kinase
MRKALLLYNPLSGARRERRRSQVEHLCEILREAGVESNCSPTQSASDTTEQARRAVNAGYDTVFACGGDGTVHDVLQALVGKPTALGVVPMGTANALAHDLHLPLDPEAAVRAALHGPVRRLAVGRVEFRNLSGAADSRYFTVTAGLGVDAYLFYQLDPGMKRRLGMTSYYAKATWLWLSHRMKKFSVELTIPGEQGLLRSEVTQLLAVRIRHFGGVLRELAPGASLDRNDLRAVLFQTSSRWAYLRFVIGAMIGARWEIAGIESHAATGINCQPLEDQAGGGRIFVEADGELLGTVPATVSVVPDGVSLIVPAT